MKKRKRNVPGPRPGSRQSAAHKKKISKSVTGKSNSQYKDGRRSYRRIAGAGNNSGEVVHHKDGNRKNNKRSNLVKLKGKKPGTNTTTKHEKITSRGQGRKRSYKYLGEKKVWESIDLKTKRKNNVYC